MLTDKDIRLLIADNQTEKAIAAISAYLEKYDFPTLQDDLALLSAKWEAWEDHRRDGTHSPDKLAEQKAQIDKALLSINRELFKKLEAAGKAEADEKKPRPKPKGIREDKFKMQVFIFMVAAKVIVIGWVFFHQSTGGLSSKQALATITLLLPTFSMYTAAMFNDFLENRYVSDKERIFPYIKNSLRWITYVLFPVYMLALLTVVGNQAQGEFMQGEIVQEVADKGMEKMTTWLSIIETGLGVYIGKIVFTLFKKAAEGK